MSKNDEIFCEINKIDLSNSNILFYAICIHIYNIYCYFAISQIKLNTMNTYTISFIIKCIIINLRNLL